MSYEDEDHVRIARKLQNLDNSRSIVAGSFIVFWFFWGIALVASIIRAVI